MRERSSALSWQRVLALLAVGLAIAVIGSLCGVGGGIFAVPVLHYGFRLGLKPAVATSLVLVFATSSASTLSELLHPRGELYPSLALTLIVSSLLGAELGHRLVKRFSPRVIKALFCFLLLAVGIHLLFSLAGGAVVSVAAAAGYRPNFADLAITFVVGACSGVVVPMLGIGGGLLVVPSMLYFLPSVGYLGARAASHAMATITTGRSTLVYHRQGSVNWRHGGPLALGALFGGIVGGQLVHRPGATLVAEAILGATLLSAGTRFGMDVWRGRAAGAPR